MKQQSLKLLQTQLSPTLIAQFKRDSRTAPASPFQANALSLVLGQEYKTRKQRLRSAINQVAEEEVTTVENMLRAFSPHLG